MKKVAIFIINIVLVVCLLNVQTSALEKNYKWIQLSLYGGVITSLCETDGNMYCGTSGNGVYVSNSNSAWEHIENNQLPNYINCLHAVGESVYCGTNEFIFKRTDEKDWEKVSGQLENEKIKVSKIISSGEQENYILFAATDRGLYRSTDKAESWEKPQKNMMFSVEALVNDKNHPERMFLAGGNSKLFTSIDYGKTWEEVFNDKSYGKIISLQISNVKPEILYAGTPSRGMYVSRDLGKTWNSISENLKNLYISFLYQDDENILFAGTYDGLYYYLEEKESWKSVGKGLLNKNLLTGFKSKKNNTWYVGTNGDGVRELPKNTEIWRNYNTGIKNLHVRCLLQDENCETVICGTWGAGIYRSFDSGKSWNNVSSGLANPYILSLHKVDEKKYLAGTYNGGIYESTDNGLSWKKMDTASLFSKYIYSIASNPANENELTVGTNGNLFRSVDSGKNWRKLSLGNWDNPIGNVNDIKYNDENTKEIVVATSETGMYMTKDGGEEWFSVGESIANQCITSVLYHPFEKNKIFCTTFGSGVYYSIDSGNSWKQ
ncbi:MAG: hypothetical protein KAH01_05560, partial [Caldisericia bacterium]|nr:hypothetical protein [Caldisericia bacterium]